MKEKHKNIQPNKNLINILKSDEYDPEYKYN
jgi:hypothetical protein